MKSRSPSKDDAMFVLLTEWRAQIEMIVEEVPLNYRTGSGSDLAVTSDSTKSRIVLATS